MRKEISPTKMNSDDGERNNRIERPTDEGRCCWVCFATNDDDALAEWVGQVVFLLRIINFNFDTFN